MILRDILSYGYMMADRPRMKAYQTAIQRVCPGRVVCEVGVGLGPLSLMALKAGAKRVYGIEARDDVLRVTVEVMAHNGFGPDRFIPVPGVSTRLKLPEPADVVLSETLDSMGLGENTLEFMRDARRFLRPGGVFLPSHLECHVALANPESWRSRRRFWEDELQGEFGLSYGPIVEKIRATRHGIEVRPEELLSGWERWQRIDFSNPKTFLPCSPVLLVPTKPGEVLGLATAFDATLCEGVHLRNRSEDPLTHWFQGFHPLPQPVKVAPGDAVYTELLASTESLESLRLEMRVASGPWNDVEAVVRRRLVELSAHAPPPG